MGYGEQLQSAILHMGMGVISAVEQYHLVPSDIHVAGDESTGLIYRYLDGQLLSGKAPYVEVVIKRHEDGSWRISEGVYYRLGENTDIDLLTNDTCCGIVGHLMELPGFEKVDLLAIDTLKQEAAALETQGIA